MTILYKSTGPDSVIWEGMLVKQHKNTLFWGKIFIFEIAIVPQGNVPFGKRDRFGGHLGGLYTVARSEYYEEACSVSWFPDSQIPRFSPCMLFCDDEITLSSPPFPKSLVNLYQLHPREHEDKSFPRRAVHATCETNDSAKLPYKSWQKPRLWATRWPSSSNPIKIPSVQRFLAPFY